MRKFLIILAVLLLTRCAITENVREDGYQVGDITTGVIENHASYCKPVYIPIRMVGRWMLRLIAYPVPRVCPR